MADAEPHMTSSSEETCVKLKYTTFKTNLFVSDSNKQEDISLQEAFKRYREAKQDELRQARLLRKRQELRKADPQKMAALRQKFVNQAKKYYGYPYARKYWPPDSPEYNSKLFLDCCGLVRKVMRDLAEDFGFIIGPWNQAYMFDTLPMVVENEKDMKPGDLVFISATYYNPKSKKQRHNMTHVEIWAGEGCKTIGARWNNGKVQTWDSYKFLAKSYHSETYHFRSLDTWLKGICSSHCAQHSWRRSKYIPTKKSIFALPEQIDEDEAAGDDDDNVDTFNMRGNTFISQLSSVNKMLTQCKVTERERPKTELSSPCVGSSSPVSKHNPVAVEAEFPTIKNDLKGKTKKVSNKQKKVKYLNEGKQKDRLLRTENGKQGRNFDSISFPTSVSAGAENNPEERNKEPGQLSISGSLNDLGRKGLYLRDLVDSQKQDNDEFAVAENTEGNTGALEDTEENDYDDDYFIFVEDEDSDREDARSAHSDDSSEFIMGEDIESDDENVTKCGKAINSEESDRTIESLNGALHVNTGMDKMNELAINQTDGVTGEQGEPSVEKTCSDENSFQNIEQNKDMSLGANKFNSQQNLHEGSEANASASDEGKITAKINTIETVIPFVSEEGVQCPKLKSNEDHENSNQNANPKVADKRQSKERGRGQFLKASVITVVSQAGPDGSHASSSPSPILPSNSQTIVSSQHGVLGRPTPSSSSPLPYASSQPCATSKSVLACGIQAGSTPQQGACGIQAGSMLQEESNSSQSSAVLEPFLPLEGEETDRAEKVDSQSLNTSANIENSESLTGAS